MNTTTDTTTALETAYKSTLAQLSHLLAFQHRIQQQGATHYAATVGPPRDLVNRVTNEAARFDQLCADLETRILRAIAVSERDARKAAGLPNPAAPSPLPAPPTPSVPSLPSNPASNSIDLTLPGADAGDDGAPLPFSLPISTAGKGAQPPAAGAAGGAMELDLTLSPSPPPSTSRPTTAIGAGAGAAEAPLPFQLPVSSSSSSTPAAAAAAPQPPDLSSGGTGGAGGGDDDLNALLSSLNMPPFDPSSSLSSSLASSIPPSAVPAPLPALATQPDFSTPEGLMAFLSSSTSSTASAPPAPLPAQQQAAPNIDFSALGLSTAPSAPPPAVALPAGQDLNNLGLGSLDFSALLSSSSSNPSSSSIPSAAPPLADVGGGGGGGGLADFDFSSLTNDPTGGLGEFDFASGVFGAGGGGGSGAADLDELLRNLG